MWGGFPWHAEPICQASTHNSEKHDAGCESWSFWCSKALAGVTHSTSPHCFPRTSGNSQHKLGTAAAGAVKRIHLDDRIARAAARAGAELREGFEVGTDVTFDAEEGLWTVKSVEVRVVG